MTRRLIVGCSFVEQISASGAYYNPTIDLYGSPAAANTSIAARVLYQINKQSYQHVTVLWSGINRISLPVDLQLHQLYQNTNDPFCFYDQQGFTVWYHSGGILGPDTNTNMPSWIKRYFEEQYKTASSRYLTDQSMSAVASVQSILSARSIPYSMSFIYDTKNSYSGHGCAYSLGTVDCESDMLNLVDWDQIYQEDNPYDYALRTGQIESDLFHPTGDCMIQWIGDHLGVSLQH